MTPDTLDNGFVRLRFTQTTAQTGGAFVEVEATYAPRSPPPPLHLHPRQEERFDVLQGGLVFEVDGARSEVRAGSSIVVPQGSAHRAWNLVDDETKVVWRTQPALSTERFFRTVYGLAMDGKAKRGRPPLLYSAVIARRFADVFRVVSPPRIVQTCVFGLLAPIAALTGVAADVDGYSR